MRTATYMVLLPILFPVVLFGQQKEKKLDPCTLLSATDAASITGTPMFFLHGGKEICQYADPKPHVFGATRLDREVTLEIKSYKSSQVTDKEWGKLTAIHNQVLGGIGDEAYLSDTAQGEGFGAREIDVRKGSFIIRLANLGFKLAPSPDTLIAVARKIADQL